MLKMRRAFFGGLVVLFLFPQIASGQAVFLARKALGLIQRVADEAQGHETASVLLEADADKVFAGAERIIREKPENEILSLNKAERSVSFRRADRTISLKVGRLQDDLAQILVVSSGGDQPQDAAYVVNGILAICKEMGAHCWTPNE